MRIRTSIGVLFFAALLSHAQTENCTTCKNDPSTIVDGKNSGIFDDIDAVDDEMNTKDQKKADDEARKIEKEKQKQIEKRDKGAKKMEESFGDPTLYTNGTASNFNSSKIGFHTGAKYTGNNGFRRETVHQGKYDGSNFEAVLEFLAPKTLSCGEDVSFNNGKYYFSQKTTMDGAPDPNFVPPPGTIEYQAAWQKAFNAAKEKKVAKRPNKELTEDEVKSITIGITDKEIKKYLKTNNSESAKMNSEFSNAESEQIKKCDKKKNCSDPSTLLIVGHLVQNKSKVAPPADFEEMRKEFLYQAYLMSEECGSDEYVKASISPTAQTFSYKTKDEAQNDLVALEAANKLMRCIGPVGPVAKKDQPKEVPKKTEPFPCALTSDGFANNYSELGDAALDAVLNEPILYCPGTCIKTKCDKPCPDKSTESDARARRAKVVADAKAKSAKLSSEIQACIDSAKAKGKIVNVKVITSSSLVPNTGRACNKNFYQLSSDRATSAENLVKAKLGADAAGVTFEKDSYGEIIRDLYKIEKEKPGKENLTFESYLAANMDNAALGASGPAWDGKDSNSKAYQDARYAKIIFDVESNPQPPMTTNTPVVDEKYYVRCKTVMFTCAKEGDFDWDGYLKNSKKTRKPPFTEPKSDSGRARSECEDAFKKYKTDGKGNPIPDQFEFDWGAWFKSKVD